MPYRLRITAGPSLELSAQRLIRVNDDERPLEIRSPHFRGRITVRVKDFPGVFGDDSSPDENRGSSSYFDNKRATFSLQCQGQYGDPTQSTHLTADDLMFGIVLREPLSDTPPLGLSLIERTMRFFWPIMECDLRSSSPWVLSPLFATVSRAHVHTRQQQTPLGNVGIDEDPGKRGHSGPTVQRYFREDANTRLAPQEQEELPPWPGIMSNAESENAIAALAPRMSGAGSTRSRAASYSPAAHTNSKSAPASRSRPSLFSSLSSPPSERLELSAHSKARKQRFSVPLVRKNTTIHPADTITTDFRNSFINFQDFSLSVPGVPFRLDLSRYMVNRPVQYVCRSRKGDVFWAIVFTILKED